MKHSIAELKISYYPKKLGKQGKITHSEKAYEVLLEHWDKDTLEFQEKFKNHQKPYEAIRCKDQ